MNDARLIRDRYHDPADTVWVGCAAELGLELHRSDAVFASFDGGRVLTIGAPETLDPDDSLAQMIFHELCHGVVAGARGRALPDWGLDNTSDRDITSEHATLRLQAAWADRWGLRGLMASTTQWRAYWDALPDDPLADGDDPAIARAARAWREATAGAWFGPIEAALEATAAIASAIRRYSAPGSLWRHTRALHPLGGPIGDRGERCGTCAWRHRAGPGRNVERCHQHRERFGRTAPRVTADAPACPQWEPRFTGDDCPSCGACCRQGFDLVPLSRRSPLLRSHPELVTHDTHGAHLARPDGYCVALGHDADQGPFLCRIYTARPRSCRDFAVGSESCLLARRRVGLSGRPSLALRTAPLTAGTDPAAEA
ncbi:MAG: zinc/iron-chelating domain-containing protein [Proteobacteria bacterium]|nr:MAG: zinc/iron-chelating domain-containing protein [Pseudomonadota bacterium]